METVRNVLLDIASSTPRVLKTPKPVVRFLDFQDSAIGVALYIWVSKPEFQDDTMTAVNEAIIEKFRDAGISIPFPQRDINVVPNQSDVLDT